ncbi:MAG: nucleoside diphosphate kinase regulator [Pseudomonadales bacterium]
MTQTRSVLVCERDYARLLSLVTKSEQEAVELLYDELDAATVIPDAELPADVVAMGSIVTFRDTDTGEESTVELVYPAHADAARRRISILAPVGAALIGLRVGEQIAWPLPNGRDRNLEVKDVRAYAWSEP